MSKAEKYLNKNRHHDRDAMEIFRQNAVRLFVVLGGFAALFQGFLEMAFHGGDEVAGVMFLIAGILCILFGLKPRKEGR